MRLCDAIFFAFLALFLAGCQLRGPQDVPHSYWLGEAQALVHAPAQWNAWRDDGSALPILIPEAMKAQPAFAQLVFVQQKANAQPFRADKALWGRDDYWAPPSAFFRYGGDCEDYALAKLSLLRRLGWPEDAMRVLLVQDMARGIEHAVLWVQLDGRIYLLDNQSREVLDAQAQQRYLPRYGMNAHGFWRY